MNASFLSVAIALMSCSVGANAAAPAADHDKAGDRCEAAVAETVKRMRGLDAQHVQFVGAKRALSPAADDDETGVKGEGRYRAPNGNSTPFTYSCAFNARTGATSGVMFRETAGGPNSDEAWQPDLTNVSPDACEAATAVALKDKHPRVGRIAFDSNSRQLRPAPNSHTSLEGKGAVQRAEGMNSVPFSYRCELDTRSGKVVSVQTSE